MVCLQRAAAPHWSLNPWRHQARALLLASAPAHLLHNFKAWSQLEAASQPASQPTNSLFFCVSLCVCLCAYARPRACMSARACARARACVAVSPHHQRNKAALSNSTLAWKIRCLFSKYTTICPSMCMPEYICVQVHFHTEVSLCHSIIPHLMRVHYNPQ